MARNDEHHTRYTTSPLITPGDIASAASETAAPAAARRRTSLPSHLGPWPLKRSLSEDDCGHISLDAWTAESNTVGHRPGLAEVLASIDEECRMVDRALKIEAALRDEVGGPDERTLCDEKAHVSENAAKALTILLAVAAIVIFVSAPVLTFVFAQDAWGGIVLPAEAASKAVLGVLLTIVAMAVGMVLAGAIAADLAVNKGRILMTGRSVAMAGGAAFTLGVLLTGWVLAWVLSLVSHA